MSVKKLVFVCAILTMVSVVVFGNPWDRLVELATEAYDSDDYVVAERLYSRAIEAGCRDGLVQYRHAYSQEQVRGLADAVASYRKAVGLLAVDHPHHRYFAAAQRKLLAGTDSDEGRLMLSIEMGLHASAVEYADKVRSLDFRYFSEGITPLVYATMLDRNSLAEELIARRASPNVEVAFTRETEEGAMNNRWSPLFLAVHRENHTLAQSLLRAGADPDFRGTHNGRSATPLMIAVRRGDVDLVNLLSSFGVDLDASIAASSFGDTAALMIAISKDDLGMVDLLLDLGAKTDIIPVAAGTGNFTTPLIYSIVTRRSSVTERLLSYAARIDLEIRTRDLLYASALGAAVACDNGEAIEVLGRFGLDPDASIESQSSSLAEQNVVSTALGNAAYLGHESALRSLIELGASLDLRSKVVSIFPFDDRDTLAVRDTCAEPFTTTTHRREVVTRRFSLSDDADELAHQRWTEIWRHNEGMYFGISPLVAGVLRDHAEAVSILVDAGADVNLPLEIGHVNHHSGGWSMTRRISPMTLALALERRDIAILLEDAGARELVEEL